MKIVIIYFIVIVSFFACIAKPDNNKQKTLNNDSDTLKRINKIDSLSKPDTCIDVYYQYYEKNELPDIYKIAQIILCPYQLGSEFTKAKIVYAGTLETLTREFYFNNGKSFYIKEIDDIYSPQKFDEGSKKVSSTFSQFYIYSDTSIKYIKDNKILLIEQKKKQEILKEILLVQSILFKK